MRRGEGEGEEFCSSIRFTSQAVEKVLQALNGEG